MPKAKKLLHKVYTTSNLHSAWKELNKSYRESHGLTSQTIHSFADNLYSNISQIRKRLKENKYNFSNTRAKVIYKRKPDGTLKPRGIRIPEIEDRVAQRAITRVIEPILDKKFNIRNAASFAYLRRKKNIKRGTQEALKRIITLYRERKPCVFGADIENFFDKIDKNKLLGMIFPALPDDSLNHLIKEALNQKVGNFEDIDYAHHKLFPDTGVPQGGGLSPLFANIYLSDFDKEMLNRGCGLVRYADDFVVMCKDESEAEQAYKFSKEYLKSKLGLTIHDIAKKEKTWIVRVTQKKFEFLGVRFDGKRLWPSRKKLDELEMKINYLTKFMPTRNLRETLESLNNMLEGWVSAYAHTYLEPDIEKIEKQIRTRLGVCAFRMGWTSTKKQLSERQYRFSGIVDIKYKLERQRKNFTSDEKNLYGL